MAAEADLGVEYRPLLLDPADPEDARVLAELRAEPHIEFNDLRGLLDDEFGALNNPPDIDESADADRWVYYPWRRSVLGLPGMRKFRAIRLDRNRNKLTRTEQARLETLSIGVVGQSVGHAVAYTLAQEGICGSLRLADFDELELTNLNRVPATLFDITVNKAIVTARRIAELDPYLPVEVRGAGVDEQSVNEFVQDLSLVVEECDSLDIKLSVREAARAHRIPLVMETSDRGLLDVERFDLEPDRKPFHGLLGDVGAARLRGLSTRDKAPYVVSLMGPQDVSTGMAASMVEVGETLNSWPQLAGEVMIGAASVTEVTRRIGLGKPVPSGRTRVDLDCALDGLATPPLSSFGTAPGLHDPEPAVSSAGPLQRVLECVQRAPSGGNAQPWTLEAGADEIRIALDPNYGSVMDIGKRGSAVALGAALYNARVAAAAHGMLGPHDVVVPASGAVPLVGVLRNNGATDAALAADYPLALHRTTNRRIGYGTPIPVPVLAELATAAAAEGATIRTVTGAEQVRSAAELIAESDRVRYLTPRLHRQMFAEMRWPGDDLETGIDVRSLELAPDEQAALQIGQRADVMTQLHQWSAGAALGDYALDRVTSSSAVAVVTFSAPDLPVLTQYARAGSAVARVWIHAERRGLAVHPISPVFLYSRERSELDAVSPDYADILASLQSRFLNLLGVPEYETIALVLRLSYAAAGGVRSRRRPVPDVEPRS